MAENVFLQSMLAIQRKNASRVCVCLDPQIENPEMWPGSVPRTSSGLMRWSRNVVDYVREWSCCLMINPEPWVGAEREFKVLVNKILEMEMPAIIDATFSYQWANTFSQLYRDCAMMISARLDESDLVRLIQQGRGRTLLLDCRGNDVAQDTQTFIRLNKNHVYATTIDCRLGLLVGRNILERKNGIHLPQSMPLLFTELNEAKDIARAVQTAGMRPFAFCGDRAIIHASTSLDYAYAAGTATKRFRQKIIQALEYYCSQDKRSKRHEEIVYQGQVKTP